MLAAALARWLSCHHLWHGRRAVQYPARAQHLLAAANSADTCQSYAPGGGTDIDPVQGAALAAVATFILSFGYNTETNKKREEVEGPGVQRRALLVLVGLELGAALSRKKFEKEC